MDRIGSSDGRWRARCAPAKNGPPRASNRRNRKRERKNIKSLAERAASISLIPDKFIARGDFCEAMASTQTNNKGTTDPVEAQSQAGAKTAQEPELVEVGCLKWDWLLAGGGNRATG